MTTRTLTTLGVVLALALPGSAAAFDVSPAFAGISPDLSWSGTAAGGNLTLAQAKRAANRLRSTDGLTGTRTATVCRRLRSTRAMCVYNIQTSDGRTCRNTIAVTKTDRRVRAVPNVSCALALSP
jgi:hypothetical protein